MIIPWDWNRKEGIYLKVGLVVGEMKSLFQGELDFIERKHGRGISINALSTHPSETSTALDGPTVEFGWYSLGTPIGKIVRAESNGWAHIYNFVDGRLDGINETISPSEKLIEKCYDKGFALESLKPCLQ